MVLMVAAKSIGDGAAGLAEQVLRDPARLKWISLVAAAVCAMSFRRRLARTAAGLVREADSAHSRPGQKAADETSAQSPARDAALAVLTPTPASDLPVRPAALLVEPALPQTIRAATMSLGVAYFGAVARAARGIAKRDHGPFRCLMRERASAMLDI